MATYKIYTIFMVLFLIQTAFAKPLKDDDFQIFDTSDEEEIRKNPTPLQKLVLFTLDSFVNLGKHYAANAMNVSRHILKDESMVANDKPEVLEFKKNLTTFVEKYEANKDPIVMWDIMDIYSNTTDNYSEISEDKVTPESKFIEEILKKYNADDVIVEFAKEFKTFMDEFVNMIEENKEHLEKPMLEWYDKYQSLTDMAEKIDAYTGFIELAKENTKL